MFQILALNKVSSGSSITMTIEEFLAQSFLSSWTESEQLEWKVSTKEMKDIICTISAFANNKGGIVVCGVKDDGEVIGQNISDGTLREVTQTILANTDERLTAHVARQTLTGKSVLTISINESPLKPHTAYGRPYK